ncbi:hypothetical protein MKX01_021891 [Papaver californicum]|nr:hypothetical protein MKX01_021891 [Papaver californicum]
MRKEGRKNEYVRHKLQALNQCQKMASMATKRLKELLEGRKSSSTTNGNHQNNEKSLQRLLDHELEVLVNVHEVRLEYEKQSQFLDITNCLCMRAALAEELAILKQEDGFASKGFNSPRKKNGHSRMSRIASLESMMSISSNALVAMASQLSEAEERERLRTMVDAKNLLQHMFNAAADARCRLWEKEVEVKEIKEKIKELVGLLRQSEAWRKEIENHQKLREKSVAIALATSRAAQRAGGSGNGNVSPKSFADDMYGSMNPKAVQVQKQLKFTPGIANGSIRESAVFLDQTRKIKDLFLCFYEPTRVYE